AIGERVHFLLDDVRGLADRALEELGALDDRDADLSKRILGEDLPGRGFEPCPTRALHRQDVVKPFHGADFHAGSLRARRASSYQRPPRGSTKTPRASKRAARDAEHGRPSGENPW